VAGRFRALAAIGFRRYATYRQAALASMATNTMFGFLRSYVLLAVVASASQTAAGRVAGYSAPQLMSFVWLGQGLIGVVMLWGWSDLADRIRSGDVIMDLMRPQHPVATYLAIDLGRAAFSMTTRFIPPVVVAALFFDLAEPRRVSTYPLGAISILLAVVVCFGCRYLVNSCAYWLLDNRGPTIAWTICSGVLGGLYFPLRFLPEPVMLALWLGTPFPSLLQAPLDVIAERDATPGQLGVIGLQAIWAAGLLACCGLVQRQAERKMVVQGG
jgi:ABC-2 type transport system permease protein